MALIETNLFGEKIDKVQRSIARLKAFEPEEGYYLAFSGGKDSIVVKALCDMAGVKYDSHYNATTVDPPEVVRFIIKEHPDVEIVKPALSMKRLIVKKQTPPTRISRYCCEHLKETKGDGRVTITGVRWHESVNRKNNHGIVTMLSKRNEILNTAEREGAKYEKTARGGNSEL